MSAPSAEKPSTNKPSPANVRTGPAGSRARTISMGLAAVAVALGGAYGTGRYQGMVSTDAAKRRADEHEAEKKRVTGELDAQRERAIRLEARRRLDLALRSVEERNFGLAEGHLATARVLLGRAKGIAALDELAAGIGEAKLPATDDLATTRRKLLGYLDAFDGAVPPAE